MKNILIFLAGLFLGFTFLYVGILRYAPRQPPAQLSEVQVAACSVVDGGVFIFSYDYLYDPLIGASLMLLCSKDETPYHFPVPSEFELDNGYSIFVSLNREMVWLDVAGDTNVYLLNCGEKRVNFVPKSEVSELNKLLIFQSIPLGIPVVSKL